MLVDVDAIETFLDADRAPLEPRDSVSGNAASGGSLEWWPPSP